MTSIRNVLLVFLFTRTKSGRRADISLSMNILSLFDQNFSKTYMSEMYNNTGKKILALTN